MKAICDWKLLTDLEIKLQEVNSKRISLASLWEQRWNDLAKNDYESFTNKSNHILDSGYSYALHSVASNLGVETPTRGHKMNFKGHKLTTCGGNEKKLNSSTQDLFSFSKFL